MKITYFGRECRYGALAIVTAMLCAGCSSGEEESVTDTRSGVPAADSDTTGQTGITIHIDTAYRDTIRITF